MSPKHTIFPPGRRGGSQFDSDSLGDDLYTGNPGQSEPEVPHPQDEQNEKAPYKRDIPHPPRGAFKGHAAYAARDNEKQPPKPGQPSPNMGQNKGSNMDGNMRGGMNANKGGLGGLFTSENTTPPESPARNNAGDPLAHLSPEALQAECQLRVCPECPVKKEANDEYLRAMADLENTKKRLVREREEQTRFAAESVLSDIIPSLDNLDLALQHAGNLDACRDFILGVSMTRKLLQDSLAKHGLAIVGKVGEPFDPALHEAVGMVNSPDVPSDHVCSLLSSGYTLNNRLLRPARVMVCKKG